MKELSNFRSNKLRGFCPNNYQIYRRTGSKKLSAISSCVSLFKNVHILFVRASILASAPHLSFLFPKFAENQPLNQSKNHPLLSRYRTTSFGTGRNNPVPFNAQFLVRISEQRGKWSALFLLNLYLVKFTRAEVAENCHYQLTNVTWSIQSKNPKNIPRLPVWLLYVIMDLMNSLSLV